MRLIALLAAAAAITASPALGQGPKGPPSQPAAKSGMQPMQHGSGPMMMRGDPSMHGGPAGAEYMAVMREMNQEMMQVRDTDPGRAFALMMIPHHEAGIDSARVVLKHTKDAELRKMAEESIKEQEKEVADLKSWLQRHGGLPANVK